MSTVAIHAIYDDEEPLMASAKELRTKGIKVKDVYSPFPIHGIDSVIGVPRTRLAICAFIYGITGTCLATLMMWYMMIHDWPTDVGGKPSFAYYMNVPAFIPITFESTVLCAAHGMVITYYLRCWMLPGVKAKNPDPRTTDDKFLMIVETKEENKSTIEALLKNGGASEISFK
ncbi:MAG: DUF3341 domain-containing protein [Bacteroidia bacterium]|nr:DUF3341 domain-containing protein [Bacteroidia bacterium]